MDSQHETAGWLSLGVKAADIGEAIVFFARAAEGGHLLAMLNLGEILCRRLEPEEAAAGKSYRDCSRGVVWLEKVARSGGPDAAEAQCRLGAAFSDETSDICDYAKAVFWYEQCADTCDEAAYELGMIYLEGRLGVPDYPAAEAWLRKAADSGSCRACYQLGMIAENGLTAFPDSVQAVKYYKKGSYGSPECAEALRRLGIP